MIKVKTIIAYLFVFGIIAANLSIVFNSTNDSINLNFLNQAFAQDPELIPEQTVTCSSGGQGLCYQSSVGRLWECNPADEDSEPCYYDNDIDCNFSGMTSDCCDLYWACSRIPGQ